MNIKDRIVELRRVKASSLLPNPKNWRTHPPEQQDAMRGILAEVGIADAVLARETPDGLQLIDGHLRADIAPDTEWPVLVLDVTEEEADKILATHDPLAAMAGENEEQLRQLVNGLELDSDALQAMIDDLDTWTPEPEIIEDEIPDEPEDPITKPGDLWLLGDHRLLCGDATEAEDVERLMKDAKIDMIATDPPYGVGYSGQSDTMFYGKNKRGTARTEILNDKTPEDAERVISTALQVAPSTIAFIWCAPQFYDIAKAAVDSAGYALFAVIVWNKNHANFGAMGARYKPKFEIALACKVDHIPWFGPDNEVTVWDIDRAAKNDLHPTQKPIALFARAISNHTEPAAIVYDPFLGSGTTLIAAEQLGRRCYGMEIEPKYCDVAVQRWENLTGKKAVLSDE